MIAPLTAPKDTRFKLQNGPFPTKNHPKNTPSLTFFSILRAIPLFICKPNRLFLHANQQRFTFNSTSAWKPASARLGSQHHTRL